MNGKNLRLFIAFIKINPNVRIDFKRRRIFLKYIAYFLMTIVVIVRMSESLRVPIHSIAIFARLLFPFNIRI